MIVADRLQYRIGGVLVFGRVPLRLVWALESERLIFPQMSFP
jgi:hypothetical protein